MGICMFCTIEVNQLDLGKRAIQGRACVVHISNFEYLEIHKTTSH